MSCGALWADEVIVATPTFSPDGGVFNEEKDVTVDCSTPDAVIYYTTDDSEPTEDSPVVVSGESIHLSETATLKARAFADGMDPSEIKSADFKFLIGVLDIPPAEFNALVDLYNSTNGPGWTNNANWLTDDPGWFGLIIEDGHVTGIDLTNNVLSGSIPTSVGDLTNLTWLSLGMNSLTGPIPAEIGNLTNLQALRLWINQLDGSIPDEIGDLTNLRDLGLGANRLSGSIPSSIGNLTMLESFTADNNSLSGSIPSSIAGMTNLMRLGLASNQLSGSIPQSLGNLTNLMWLWLCINQLDGSIPDEIGDLTNLRDLALGANHLSGSIPSSIGNLTMLEGFTADNNSLSDQIPTSIGNLTNLIWLGLGANQLEGGIPPEIGDLTNLNLLWLDNNQLSGSIPTQIGNLLSLEEFSLSNNQLTGPIPAELGNLVNLTSLWLNRNQLSGELPGNMANLTNLLTLDLSTNALSGSIPSWLQDFTKLENLVMPRNQFTGPIPVELGTLTSLKQLSLSYNNLTGDIPSELSALTQLTYLTLSGNSLTGAIPAWLADLTKLTSLGLRINKLSGTIPPQLGNLTSLTALTLSSNQLSGEIPASLANLTSIPPGGLMLAYNCLRATDANLITYLNSINPDWHSTQTVPPSNIHVAGVGTDYISLAWRPIEYTGDGGYYEIGISDTATGPYSFDPANQTPTKSANEIMITGLAPGTLKHLVVRTFTPTHGVWQSPLSNKSDLTSDISDEVSDSTLSSQPQAFSKSLPDGAYVILDGAAITSHGANDFYVEQTNRAFGVRGVKTNHGLTDGLAQVIGHLKTEESNLERYIDAERAYPATQGSVEPVFLTNRALGGADWLYDEITHAGQKGVVAGFGLNNIGMLVKTSGKIIERADNWFKITDGSGVDVKCIMPDLVTLDSGWQNVTVTGISSCEIYSGGLNRVIRIREQGDINQY